MWLDTWTVYLLIICVIDRVKSCSEGTFACDDDSICIPQFKNCDGSQDCVDGSDEWNCEDSGENRFWDHVYRKRPSAELEESLPINCSLFDFRHDLCTCRGEAVYCYHKTLIRLSTFPSSGFIQTLDLTGSRFPKVEKKDFIGFHRLYSLILNHVELDTVEEEAFSENFKLKELYLNNNLLKQLPENWFFEKSGIEKLAVGYNLIENLHNQTFLNLSSLMELDFRHNLLKEISTDAFRPLQSLKILFLNENSIEKIDAVSFPYLPRLETLSLAKNVIRKIEPGVFASLPNLKELFLSENRITALMLGVFDNLHLLEVLNLNGNLVKSIELGVFEPTGNLLSLNLKNNDFRKLDKGIFLSAKSLDHVYFDDFSLCSAAQRVRVCEPKGDGISSLEHLLDNTILRTSVWVMCVLACGGNVLVLLGRFLVKEPNAVHSLYIKNLSLSDLLMGIYLFIIAAADLKYRGNYVVHEEEWRQSNVCLISGFLNTLSSESSVLILSLITWDRLISITKPLSHRQPKLKEATGHLVLLWFAAFVMAGAPLMGGPYFGSDFFTSNGVCLPLHIHEPYKRGWEYSAGMFIVLNSIALGLICTAYSKMLRVIKSSALTLRSTQERQDRVVAQRFAVIVATDCFCWIPVILIKILALLGVAIPETLYAWLAIFILPINSALNPILYTLTTKLFKQQISRLFYSCKPQQETPGHGSALSLSFGQTPINHRKFPLQIRPTRSSFVHSQCSHHTPYLGTAV